MRLKDGTVSCDRTLWSQVAATVVFFSLLGIALMVWQGCQRQPQAQEALVKAWGDTLVSKRQFNAILTEHAPECKAGSEPHCGEIRQHLLKRAIEEAILVKRAVQSGITISQEEIERAEAQMLEDCLAPGQHVGKVKRRSPLGSEVVRDRLMVHRFLGLLLQGIEVDEQEVVARFLERRELFVRPREVKVRQILVASWDDAAELHRRIQKGEDFSRLAKGHSMGPEAAMGGDLGYVRPGQLPPEMEEVVFALGKGEVSEIVPSVYGFHILKVDDVVSPQEMSFADVQGEIRERLLMEKKTRFYEAWMEDQWKGAQIEILDPSLAPLADRRGKVS